MKALDNYVCEGQMTIFDFLSPDTWYGKTSPEPLAQTKEKTSGVSLKKQRGSSVKMPLFRDLRGGAGCLQAVSWQMGGALLGEYMTLSFGESPSEERGSLLSQILEDKPHPKYYLSAKACQGILRRAKNRGKQLPEQLEKALIRQSASKNEPENLGGVKEYSYNTNEQEPCQHSTTNQFSCMTIDEKVGNTYIHTEQGNTLSARDYKQPQAVYTYQALGEYKGGVQPQH